MKKQNAITELSYWKVLRTLLFIIFGSPIIYGSIQYVLFMIGGGVGKIVATFIMTWPWIAYFALPVIVFGDHFFKDGESYTITPIGLLLTTLLYLLIAIIIAFPIRNRIRKNKSRANQRVDPIVKTSGDEVEAQGTQGHP
jgi:K+-sensing histidine kinase KdpD